MTIFPAEKFTISIFANDTTTGPFSNQPADTALYSFDVGTASETLLQPGYYQYSADVTPFAITGGETYWFSVVATLPYQFDPTDPALGNVWAIPFSSSTVGDGVSIEHYAELVGDTISKTEYTSDLAFSVSAVPEPSSLLAFAAIGLVTGLRRRRRRI
ncbi:PEP-CTERM sorting domain-containing protein [Stieleria neptunia]|uniref:PEP-CTERM sorting domain-containing protein n=1 Tax=Stieleria neptunia TaxID=2527979 RepID=UPI0018D23F79|nr:PEP-CTERM sorting domain-containing protein [Stieleria neptunia]